MKASGGTLTMVFEVEKWGCLLPVPGVARGVYKNEISHAGSVARELS